MRFTPAVVKTDTIEAKLYGPGASFIRAAEHEGRIDLCARVRIVNLDLQSHCASGSVYFLQLSISGTCIGWINEYTHPRGVGQQITKQLQPLCYQLASENIDSGQIASWSRETRSQTKLHWIASD